MPLSLRSPPPELRIVREDPVDDSIDVPATVVCAMCGDAMCTGCERELSRSGIVAMIAWERPGTPVLARLWSTARATTLSGEAFFEHLPDGPIAPALRFAVLAELVAASGVAVFTLGVLGFVVPLAWFKHVALDGAAREVALRILFAGVPGLALLLVGAHAWHGLALDHGARRTGARSARGHALRFGLYSAGWDLVLGPVGAVVLALKEGARGLAALAQAGAGLPGRCARAYLRGAYRIQGARLEAANAMGTRVAIVATLLGAAAVLAAAIAAWRAL
jgi:hypothetical protein